MFQTGFLSIIRSTKLHIQRQTFGLEWYVQFCAPDDGQKTSLKHVQRLTRTEINKFEKHCILLVVL